MSEPQRTLPIRTVYRFQKEVVKTNSAGSGTNAVPLAVQHMRANDYEANLAEVYNEQSGKLHAVIRRDVTGKMTILFEHKYHEGE